MSFYGYILCQLAQFSHFHFSALLIFVFFSLNKVASWGAYLLKRNVLAMSFAPRDNHEAQVQFALERGVPAVIGVLGSIRLPYPSRAFDMAQCSRCLIPWTSNGKYQLYKNVSCISFCNELIIVFLNAWDF